MMTIPPGLLGPHPKYAVVPVLLVFGLLGWVAANNPAPSAAASVADSVAVMAMKPIEGRDEAPAAPEVPAASDSPAASDADRARMIRTAAGLPVEVLYGVPSAATMHLWSPRR
jgi:hypothetical protein